MFFAVIFDEYEQLESTGKTFGLIIISSHKNEIIRFSLFFISSIKSKLILFGCLLILIFYIVKIIYYIQMTRYCILRYHTHKFMFPLVTRILLFLRLKPFCCRWCSKVCLRELVCFRRRCEQNRV